ncbi:hypothetical protein TB2_033307 [Malus domestica]
MMVFRVIMLCHCLPLYLNLNLNLYAAAETTSEESEGGCQQELRRIVDVKGPDSIVWVVQLSDLHFSVHHPDRALDFNNFVGPALSFITPSLVFITGDLTDGKSKDLLTMKQNEDEWLEYRNVMEDVIKRSRLDKTLFFDLRRQLWRPTARRLLDFFSKYSISGHLGRSRNVNSVTLQTADRKHLFVGVDSTMPVGLRGPTNLFAHPIDQLLAELDTHLSQWNSRSQELLSKISFGHFPLSFSATSNSGKSLKDIFLNHSISAYICGHLHSRFGRNLKRRHLLSHHFLSLQKFFQLNVHRPYFHSAVNCSTEAPAGKEFWEWEMGEWKRSRAMRILAIDRGHVSYVDIDFKSGTKGQSSCQLFPWTHGSRQYLHPITNMNVMIWSLYLTAVRALVFSVSPIASITTKIYDSRPGFLYLVFDPCT